MDQAARNQIPTPIRNAPGTQTKAPLSNEHSREHVWALCRLTEQFLAHWDSIYPRLMEPSPYPEIGGEKV